MSQIQKLIETAQAISQANDASAAGKSHKNAFAWQALMIMHKGFLQDKAALEGMIKKGGQLHHCRSYVSKAKTVLNTITQGVNISIDDAILSEETLKAYSFDNLPPFTLSSIYTEIKKEARQEEESNVLEAQAHAEAVLALEEQFNQPIAELQALMPERYESLYQEAKDNALASLTAANAAQSVQSIIEQVLALTPAQQAEVLAALNSAQVAQAA